MARLNYTDISCGINQLYGVGRIRQQEYKKIMRDVCEGGDYVCGIVIASLTTKQKSAEKLLLKNGWHKVGKAVRNPNSGNMINLFVLYPNEKKSKTKKTAKRARI